jgi:uncharacterized membrane protein (DUF2068 family)
MPNPDLDRDYDLLMDMEIAVSVRTLLRALGRIDVAREALLDILEAAGIGEARAWMAVEEMRARARDEPRR